MGRRSAISSLALVTLAATPVLCGATGCGSDGAGTIDDSAMPGPSAAATAALPSTVCRANAVIHLEAPVAEAHARRALKISVDVGDAGGMRGAHPLTVSLVKADGSVVKELFDGARDAGAVELALDPSVTTALALGRYAITASVGCPAGATEATKGSATKPLFLVRVGVTSVDVLGGTGTRVSLMYHALNHEYANGYPIHEKVAATLLVPAGEPQLDDPKGTLRAFAKPWADLDSPPVDADGNPIENGTTFPVSLTVGARPDIVLAVAGSGLDAAQVPPIRVVVDGTPGSDAARAVDGKSVTIRLAQSPVPAIDRVDHDLKWHFEAKADDGSWDEIPGADQTATLRFYGVLGSVQDTLISPELPWVAVVDDATRAVAGKATDANGARSALVRHVYEELGLHYDRAQGASHYTSYATSQYGGAKVKLARFLARDQGSVVNCSDCASILSSYANMIGAELHYAIIGFNFTLHPIQGIGATMFGSPFDSGRMAFTYHAVTSGDSVATIYDATLAVDGDASAADAPYTLRLVQGIPGPEYLQRLSGDPHAAFTNVDQSTEIDY